MRRPGATGEGRSGSIFDHRPGVETGDGILSVDMIQMPGKKKMKVQDYLRGNKIEIFTVLG